MVIDLDGKRIKNSIPKSVN